MLVLAAGPALVLSMPPASAVASPVAPMWLAGAGAAKITPPAHSPQPAYGRIASPPVRAGLRRPTPQPSRAASLAADSRA